MPDKPKVIYYAELATIIDNGVYGGWEDAFSVRPFTELAGRGAARNLVEYRPYDPEAALAIGEHAFRAGYVQGHGAGWHRDDCDPDGAWSDYDPPEDIKALS